MITPTNAPLRRESLTGLPAAGSPAAIAQSITGRSYISWSQVQQYQMCPRAFEFKYVLKAEPNFVPSSLIFGSAMHEAFAQVHTSQLEGIPIPTPEELNQRLSNAMNSTLLPIRYTKTESATQLHSLGGRMIDAFLASPEAQPLGTPVCIEDRVSGIIDPLIPPIEGKTDFVRSTDEGLILRDYKTTKSKWNLDKVEEAAPQLRLYAALLDHELDGWKKVVGIEFVTVTKAKTPIVQLHQVHSRPESIGACVSQIGEVWRGIESGVFPTRPGWPCKSCPFASQCPAAIGTHSTVDGADEP